MTLLVPGDCDSCGVLVRFVPSHLAHVPVLCGSCFIAQLRLSEAFA